MLVRSRFAPSPTGFLHVGSARTALFSWLYAKGKQGVFILRIEDTDRERSTEEAVKAIFDGMEWMGLTEDEGPFFQTDRLERYQSVAEELLQSGHAYKCTCSKQRLEELRESQMKNGDKPRYDGFCREKNLNPKDGPFVIRFRNPNEGEVVINDQVYGQVTFKNSELDDLVIVRTDGMPTYNFSVVVDDSDMKVTHVIRGDDHLNNTPRQINMLQALGANLPVYAHVPMILGSDGKKLSKRHGAVSVMQYRDDGFLPIALLNYLVRLGWSHGDQEIFNLDEMIQLFDIKDINKAPAAFDPQKLLWLNQHYLKTCPIDYVKDHALWHFEKQGINLNDGPPLEAVIVAQRERIKTLKELAERSRFFYEDDVELDREAINKHITPDVVGALQDIYGRFEGLQNWNEESIHNAINAVAEDLSLKLGKIAQPLRIAATGGTISPPIDVTLALIGKKRVLDRLQKVIALTLSPSIS